MKEKKDNSLIYLVSTLSFIFMGIILTGIINRTQSQDVRTRASATSGIAATAVVSDVQYETSTIIVDQLTFQSSPQKNLGQWTVAPPSAFNLDSVVSGNAIRLVIEPTSLAITKHTLTAKEIKKK